MALDGRNVEIKARVRDPRDTLRRIEALPAESVCTVKQTDVFFHCPRGRLKLRVEDGSRARLIHYERADDRGPAVSRYRAWDVGDHAGLRGLLGSALGEAGVVEKTRRIFKYGQTRIHFDEVAGLGCFVELEVELRPGQGEVEGRAIAREIATRLDIREDDLVACAYLDLLLEGS